MTDTPADLDARNAKLEARFVASRLYDPTLERKIAPNAHVVLLPIDDPELEAHNRAYAKQLQAKGQPVQFLSEADLLTKEAIAQKQEAGRQAYLGALADLKRRMEEGSPPKG